MGSQLNQDIRSALLNIERDTGLDWDDIDHTTRQVLADIGTRRAQEENQRVANYQANPEGTQEMAEVEVEEYSSSNDAEDAKDDEDNQYDEDNGGGGVASSQTGASQKQNGSYLKSIPTKRSALTPADKPFVCAFCGARYKHGRSRYRHHGAFHADLPFPSSSEVPDHQYDEDDAENDAEGEDDDEN